MTAITRSPRSLRKRLVTIAASLATVAGLALAGGLPSASAAPDANKSTAAKPTVVFVHGAWTDASSFDGVQRILTRYGYPVLDFANPLRSLSGDSDYLASFLETRTEGPVILVGHSYGGAVVGQAALTDPDVRGLVYVDAFVPAEGESLLDLLNSAGPVDPTQLFDTVPYPGAVNGDADLYLKKEAFNPGFANGLPKNTQAEFYSKQRPITFGAVSEKAAANQAWSSLPSWYVAGTEDASIPLALQLKMAERAGSTVTKVKAGHLAMVKDPRTVAHVIETAAKSTK
jgi:pimeloyl-ACP methyl ester carboxylesterase